MRAKGLLSVVMTGAMMMGVLSGCGFEPDITWTDTADGSESSYKVTVVVAHDGKLNIKSEQTVKDGDTLNFIATPSKDGDHRITGLMIDGVKRTDYTGELPLEGEVKISLENINQDMTVVVLCDNETGGLGGVDGAVTGVDGTGTDTGTDTDTDTDPDPDTVTVTVVTDGSGTGTGTVEVDGIPVTNSTSVDYGKKVTITVAPDTYSKVTNATVDSASMTSQGNGYTYTTTITQDTTIRVKFDRLSMTMNGTLDDTWYLADGTIGLDDISDLSITVDGGSTIESNEGVWTIDSSKVTAANANQKVNVTVNWKPDNASNTWCTKDFEVTVYAMTSDAASKLEGEFTTKYLDQFNAGRKDDKWERAGKAGSNITEAMDAIEYNGTYDTGKVRVKNERFLLYDNYKYIRKTVIVTSQAEAEAAFEAFYREIVGPAIDGVYAQQAWYQGAYVFIDLDSTTGECTMGVVYDGFYGI